MTTLAFEFSSDRRTVAVVRGGAILGRSLEEGGRESRPFVLIEEALGQAGCGRESIGRLALGLGPGSFAGVRTAIAVALGWRLVRSVVLVGISSLELMAEGARREGWLGRVSLAVDAQRGEFHVAGYEITATGVSLRTGLRLASGGDLEALAGGGELVAGPGMGGWFGNGRTVYPDAGILGLLAEGRGGMKPEELSPITLRPASFVKAPAPRAIPSA